MKGVLQILLFIPLAVSAAVEFVPSGFTVQKLSSSDHVLQNGTVYCVTENLGLTGTNAVVVGGTGGSALSVAPGATVYLHIEEGVTLSCTGGNGAPGTAGGANASPAVSRVWDCTVEGVTVKAFDFNRPSGGAPGIGGGGGGAGIHVPQSSSLVVFGGGQLKATGGAGGRAGDAGSSANRGLYAMTAWCTIEKGIDFVLGPTNYLCNTRYGQTWKVGEDPLDSGVNCSVISGQPSSGGGGGGGAGGGGAAIGMPGQSGSEGTKGAESALKWVYSTTPGAGETNRLACVSAAAATVPPEGGGAGTVRFGKELGLTLMPGIGGSGGSPGSDACTVSPAISFYWAPLTGGDPPVPCHTQRLYMAEGQCGGAGGAGGKGAEIGRGGRGGQGGRGGDSGSLVCELTPGRPDTPFANGPLEPLSALGANGTAGGSSTNDVSAKADVSIFKVSDDGCDAAIRIKPFGGFYNAHLVNGDVGEKNSTLVNNCPNQLPLWQNYLLGLWQDTAQPFWADVPQGKDPASATVFAKVGAQRPDPAETGIGVAFRLDAKLRGATAETPGEPCAEPVLPLALGAADPTGMYRVKAVFTNSSGFVSLAPATNLIGVLRKGADTQRGGRRRDCMSVPWTELSSDNTKHGVAVSNVVRTAQLDPGDRLYRYDAYNGCYNVWKLDLNLCWQPLTTVVAADETSGTSPSGPASTTRIQRGAAFWLERDVSRPLDFIGGNEKRAPWVLVTAGTPEQPKWNLVSAAGYDAFGINVINTNVDSRDRIILPTGGEPIVFTFADGKWSHSEYVVDDQGVVTVVRKDDKTDIPAGSGFWYVSEGGSPMIKFPEVKLK